MLRPARTWLGYRWHVAVIVSAVWLAAFSPDAPRSLDEKLDRQFDRFQQATELVIETYRDPSQPPADHMISRARWEELLAPGPGEAFSDRDMDDLRSRQASVVEASRQQAIAKSVVDFRAWRALPPEEADRRIREFCDTVPKGAMLHIHPWGTLDQATVQALLEQNDPVVPAAKLAQEFSDPTSLAWLYPDELAWLRGLPEAARYSALAPADQARLRALLVLPPGVHRFPRFEAMFTFVAMALDEKWASMEKALEDFARRAVRDGVFYVEFTESIRPDEVAAYEALGQRLQDSYGLTVRFNHSFFRTSPAAANADETLTMLREVHSPWIVGIDLLADESNTPALEHGQVIYGPVLADVETRGGTWRRTMHAGELGDDRDPRDAMLLGAQRIGHGVRLERDPVTLQYAAMRKFPIAINLTSNLKLGAVDDIASHPYLKFLRLGLPVSLSTDDEGMFDTDAAGECVLAVSKTDVTYYEYRAMAFNSIRASFADDALKQSLVGRLERAFTAFEHDLKP